MFSFSVSFSSSSISIYTTFLAIVNYTARVRIHFLLWVTGLVVRRRGAQWLQGAAGASSYSSQGKAKAKQAASNESTRRWFATVILWWCSFLFPAFHLSPIAAVAPAVAPSTPAPPLQRYYFLMKCFCRRRSADAATTAQRNKPTPLSQSFLSLFLSFLFW